MKRSILLLLILLVLILLLLLLLLLLRPDEQQNTFRKVNSYGYGMEKSGTEHGPAQPRQPSPATATATTRFSLTRTYVWMLKVA